MTAVQGGRRLQRLRLLGNTDALDVQAQLHQSCWAQRVQHLMVDSGKHTSLCCCAAVLLGQGPALQPNDVTTLSPAVRPAVHVNHVSTDSTALWGCGAPPPSL